MLTKTEIKALHHGCDFNIGISQLGSWKFWISSDVMCTFQEFYITATIKLTLTQPFFVYFFFKHLTMSSTNKLIKETVENPIKNRKSAKSLS